MLEKNCSGTLKEIEPVPSHLAGKLKLQWYPFLHFLGGVLSREKALELIEGCSSNYFKIKGTYHLSSYMKFLCPPVDCGVDILLWELNLSYALLEELNIPLPEAPEKLAQEIDFLVSNNIFRPLAGKAQTYIFRNASAEHRKKFVENSICTMSYNQKVAGWGNKKMNSITPAEGFNFGVAGIELIISYLSAQEEFYFPRDRLPQKRNHYLSPVSLVVYLPQDQAGRDLWLEYLKSDQPNRMYAAEVLAEMSDQRSIKCVLKLKEELPPNPFEENSQKHRKYEERMAKPIKDFFEKLVIQINLK